MTSWSYGIRDDSGLPKCRRLRCSCGAKLYQQVYSTRRCEDVWLGRRGRWLDSSQRSPGSVDAINSAPDFNFAPFRNLKSRADGRVIVELDLVGNDRSATVCARMRISYSPIGSSQFPNGGFSLHILEAVQMCDCEIFGHGGPTRPSDPQRAPARHLGLPAPRPSNTLCWMGGTR
jgi:hypothetical protein